MNFKKHYFLPILKEGDTVLSITEHVIAVRSVTGEARAYFYHYDEKGVPRLEKKSLMITRGEDATGMGYDCVGSENLPF